MLLPGLSVGLRARTSREVWRHSGHSRAGGAKWVRFARRYDSLAEVWLASRSSFCRQSGPPSPRLRWAAFACIHERRLERATGIEPD